MYDALSLTDRVAIVAGGAAGGIGLATIDLMIERGARIAIAGIDLGRAQAIAAKYGNAALAIETDLADEVPIIAMVKRAAAHFGRIDILHNMPLLWAPSWWMLIAALPTCRHADMPTWAWDIEADQATIMAKFNDEHSDFDVFVRQSWRGKIRRCVRDLGGAALSIGSQ